MYRGDDSLKANFQKFRQNPTEDNGTDSSVLNNNVNEESVTSDRYDRMTIISSLLVFSYFRHFICYFSDSREGAKEESDGLSRRGNGLVLNDEMSERLKDLYEKLVLSKFDYI